MSHTHPYPHRKVLAALIAVVLTSGTTLTAHAGDAIDCEGDPDHSACVDEGSSRTKLPWILGGAALVAAAAASGGGGSDQGGSGPGSEVPGHEGGQYDRNQHLTAAGAELSWNQNVETRVVGDARNEGTLHVNAGTLVVRNDGHLRNRGALHLGQTSQLLIQNDGSLENHGAFSAQGADIHLDGESDIENLGRMTLRETRVTLAGESEFDNGERRRDAQLIVEGGGFVLGGMSEFENHGTITASGSFAQGALVNANTARVGNDRDVIEAFNNHGSLILHSDAGVLALVADTHASTGINRMGGQITSHARGQSALYAEGAQATLLNQGTITVTGDGAVAMSGTRGATLINDGVINLGVAGGNNGQNMIALQSDGSATLNNRRSGVINIHADNSHAFKMGSNGGGRLINNGQVNVYGSGSGVYADAATQGTDRPAPDLGWLAPKGISGYTVGTHADGSAGQLVLHDGGALADVTVDTGFTRGTPESQIRLHDVFVGADSGEENIASATIVWRAEAKRDVDGNVDVTMTRNDYRDLAAQSHQGIATALEAGYDNNALYHSLEVSSEAEFNRALSQLSGTGLAAAGMRLTANADAFWSSLARATPYAGYRMLAFGAGSQDAAGVQGVGTGVQVALALGNGRQLQFSTGLLGSDFSTDGGQTRSQSRFAGVGLARSLGAFTLQHHLGNEWHRTDGQRQLNWGSTRLSAHSQRTLSRTRFGSTLTREFAANGLHWQPRLGAHAYHANEGAFHEYGADALGLSVGAGARSGVQMEMGTAFRGALGSGWTLRGDAALLGSLSHRATDRDATLHGADGEVFQVPGQSPSGTDYRLMLGADYRHRRVNLGGSVFAERLLGMRGTRAQLHLNTAF